MPTRNITINANGQPSPRGANLFKNSANGDNSIQWQAGAGTHTITNLPDIFTVTPPPASISVSPGNPSDTYTVRSDATTGTFDYNVNGPTFNGQPQIILNP